MTGDGRKVGYKGRFLNVNTAQRAHRAQAINKKNICYSKMPDINHNKFNITIRKTAYFIILLILFKDTKLFERGY